MSEKPPLDKVAPPKLAPLWRGLIEVCFIIFLYYSNLLMGEYERSGQGRTKGLFWAMQDTLTEANFIVAVATALVGYLIIEFLRKRF
jgi:hypothetical protein